MWEWYRSSTSSSPIPGTHIDYIELRGVAPGEAHVKRNNMRIIPEVNSLLLFSTNSFACKILATATHSHHLNVSIAMNVLLCFVCDVCVYANAVCRQCVWCENDNNYIHMDILLFAGRHHTFILEIFSSHNTVNRRRVLKLRPMLPFAALVSISRVEFTE